MISKILPFIFVFSNIFPHQVQLESIVGNANNVYTAGEKQALEKLRQEVKNDLYLEYQNHDRFLINWLRNKQYDVTKAATALKMSLKHRKENNIDNILTEPEMLALHKSYPATFDKAVDKLGNPAYQLTYSKWDIRKAMLTGKREALTRYIFFIFESNMAAMRRLGATNFIWFPDMSNYNLRQHACLACIPWYVDLVNTYERHYPNTIRYIIAFNVPRIFETVSNIMLQLMSEETRRAYKVFGTNRSEWQKFVLQVFDADQLTKQYGGTKA